MGLSDSYSKNIYIMKVLLICTSTSQTQACISELVHQHTSDLQWMRVSGRQCVQGNGNTNALTPRVSVLISALSNSRLPHMSFTHTCQKAGSTRRGLSYRTSTPLLVFSQCSFCKPFLLKEALQKVGLSRSMGSVHQRPSMSLCCVCSQWRSRVKGAKCSQTRVACCGEEEKWMAKWGLIELWEAESQSRTEFLRQTEVGTSIHEANETVYLCDIPCVAEMGVGEERGLVLLATTQDGKQGGVPWRLWLKRVVSSLISRAHLGRG